VTPHPFAEIGTSGGSPQAPGRRPAGLPVKVSLPHRTRRPPPADKGKCLPTIFCSLSIAIQEKNYFTDNPRDIFLKSIIFHAGRR
jgi:hypothetical protein